MLGFAVEQYVFQEAFRHVVPPGQFPDGDRATTRMLGEGEENPQGIIGFL
jgi:hypothetical protein